MWQAFDRLRSAWESSGFRTRLTGELRTMIREGGMSQAKASYWRSNTEMFARTFERYVQRRLEMVGHKNTYLAGIETKGYKEGGLWPTDAEVDAMAPAFDAIFRELSTGIDKGRYWLRELGDRLVLERRTALAERFARMFQSRGFALRYSQFGQESPSDRRQLVEDAAAETDRDPSEAQKLSGNYRKGKCRIYGLEIAIETPQGAVRSGTDRNGKPWSITMPYHYGYIKRTESEADGDHIDVFLGPDLDSELVFVVDQVRPDSGRFDEHKVMLGWTSEEEAKEAYQAAYSEGWRGFEAITPMTLAQFHEWLQSGDSGHRIAEQVKENR